MADKLRQVFDSSQYELTMCCAIVLNAVVIGLQIDYRESLPLGGWFCVNLIFFLIFFVEAVLKIFAFGVRTYFADKWNVYDFIVTFACFIEMVASYTFFFSSTSFYKGWKHYVSGDMVQIARLIRLGKLSYYFTEVKILFGAFFTSLRALGWIFMGAIIVFYIAACIVTVFLGRRQFHKANGDPDAREIRERFSTIPMSMFALFEIMTLEGWVDYVRPLLQTRPEFVFFFLIFIFISTFFLLNLVTSVVVDRTLAEQDKSDEKQEKSRSAKKLADTKEVIRVFRNLNRGRDLVNKDNLVAWAQGDAAKSLMKSVGENEAFVSTMFELLDHDEDGEISLDALQSLWIAYEEPLDTHNFLRFHINIERRMEYLERLTVTALQVLEKTSGRTLHLPSEITMKTASFLPRRPSPRRPSPRDDDLGWSRQSSPV